MGGSGAEGGQFPAGSGQAVFAGCSLRQPIADEVGVTQADEAIDFLALVEQDDGREAIDSQARLHFLVHGSE